VRLLNVFLVIFAIFVLGGLFFFIKNVSGEICEIHANYCIMNGVSEKYKFSHPRDILPSLQQVKDNIFQHLGEENGEYTCMPNRKRAKKVQFFYEICTLYNEDCGHVRTALVCGKEYFIEDDFLGEARIYGPFSF